MTASSFEKLPLNAVSYGHIFCGFLVFVILFLFDDHIGQMPLFKKQYKCWADRSGLSPYN